MNAAASAAATSEPVQRAVALRTYLADRLSADLPAFTKKAFQVLYPNRKLVWSPHYDLLCEYLQLVKQRRILRLIINIPPRTLKSTLTTIVFPVWVWLSEP